MASKFFHHNNRFNCSKTEHWHLACPLQTAEGVRMKGAHTYAEQEGVFGATTWRDWKGGSSTMSVLSLSPDCVYEHEAAWAQWSSSPVYASTLHPHGPRREVESTGSRAVLVMRARRLENEVTCSLRKSRWGFRAAHKHAAWLSIGRLRASARRRNRSGGLRRRAKNKET